MSEQRDGDLHGFCGARVTGERDHYERICREAKDAALAEFRRLMRSPAVQPEGDERC